MGEVGSASGAEEGFRGTGKVRGECSCVAEALGRKERKAGGTAGEAARRPGWEVSWTLAECLL